MNILKRNKYLVLGLLVLISGNIFGQQVIKGVVTDASDNSRLPGANIIIKNANNRILHGGITDLDGNYTVRIKEENVILQVTFIGYKPKEIPITDQTVINIALEKEFSEIEEIVVTAERHVGGYLKVDKRNLASSITTVDIKDLTNSAATSVTEILQGRATGVQITANSGDPGAGFNIKIRGSTSLNASNSPLIVIDNVPYEGDVNLSDISDLTSANSPLTDINPDDIESIEVLKDAGATAIYGSKGANGVILITTKRGKRNETVVSYNSKVTIRNAPESVPLLSGDDLKILILEGMQNNDDFELDPDDQVYPELRDDETRTDYYNYNNNTDWMDEIQRRGFTADNTFSLRGGGNTTRYSFSVGSSNQQGVTNGTGYNRLTTSFNLDYAISDKLQFKSSTGYTTSKSVTSEIKKDWNTWIQNPIATARQYPSFLPVYRMDEDGNETDEYYIPVNREITLYNREMYNPVAWTNLVALNKYNNRFRTNVRVIFDILEGFNFTSSISVDFNNNTNDYLIPEKVSNRDWNDDQVNWMKINSGSDQQVVQENLISYQRNINDVHVFTVMGVTKLTWWKDRGMTNEATNLASEETATMSATNQWVWLDSWSGEDIASTLIGQFHYALLDRYILQGTVNYEGSSKFGPSNRYATFPTLAGSWRISSEPFMSNLNFLNDLKVSYSFGSSGNAPKDKYLYFSRYKAGVRYLDEIGVTPDNIQLNTLKWETTTTNNYKLDVAMFNNRWKFTFEAYQKYTSDLLMERYLPASSGVQNKYWTNFGDVSNKGLEFFTDIRIIDSELKWDVNFNISTISNKIEDLPDDIDMAINWDNGYPTIAIEGDPIGSFYGLIYDGVFKTDDDAVAKDANGNVIYDLDGEPKRLRYNNSNGYIFKGGDAIYRDINHDGLINDLDRVKIGSANEDFYGGFGTRLAWKAWTMDCFLQYKAGNDIINVARKQLEAMPGGDNKNKNQATSVLRRWRKQGDETDIPRVTFDPNHHNNEGSDRFVEDGTFLRLKNISLTYNIPTKVLNKIKLRSASIFISGENLLTFTNYTGQDPEISVSGKNPWAVGMDKNKTAISKSFTGGIKITFK